MFRVLFRRRRTVQRTIVRNFPSTGVFPYFLVRYLLVTISFDFGNSLKGVIWRIEGSRDRGGRVGETVVEITWKWIQSHIIRRRRKCVYRSRFFFFFLLITTNSVLYAWNVPVWITIWKNKYIYPLFSHPETYSCK